MADIALLTQVLTFAGTIVFGVGSDLVVGVRSRGDQ